MLKYGTLDDGALDDGALDNGTFDHALCQRPRERCVWRGPIYPYGAPPAPCNWMFAHELFWLSWSRVQRY
eukprot:4595794-Prymnesium_polylepis.2